MISLLYTLLIDSGITHRLGATQLQGPVLLRLRQHAELTLSHLTSWASSS